MKIALVSADAAPVDADDHRPADRRVEYVAHLARELAAAGHVVDVFARRDDLWTLPVVELAPNARAVNVPAGPPRPVPADTLLAHMDDFATRFVQACTPSGGYDVVHASGFLSGIAALRLKQRCGTPFIMTFHELGRVLERQAAGGCGPLGAERARIEAALSAGADRVIARGRQELDDVVALHGADADRIDVISPGVDPTAFRPGSRASRRVFGLSTDEFVLVHAAQFRSGEGSDTAIRAVARLKRAHGLSARLVICSEIDDGDIGLASAVARLRALAAAELVADQVKFVRARSRSALRDAYCSADVVVATPSSGARAEPPLEAMACGAPVIGSDVEPIRTAVQDRATGYLVPPDDPAAVADRLARIRRNPELGRAYGRGGVLRVRTGLTWYHMATAIACVYAAVLAPHRARLAAAASSA